MKYNVKTTIDGQVCNFQGRIKNNILHCAKGMRLTIYPDDVVTEIPEVIRVKSERIECPFDMHQFFKKTKQIK